MQGGLHGARAWCEYSTGVTAPQIGSVEPFIRQDFVGKARLRSSLQIKPTDISSTNGLCYSELYDGAHWQRRLTHALAPNSRPHLKFPQGIFAMRAFLLSSCLCVAAMGFSANAMAAETAVKIAIAVPDIPRTLGQPDQGFEGVRFTGNTMYEALTAWDPTSPHVPGALVAGLSTEWQVDANDETKWIFKLRSGVRFHDGANFDADAVVWNVDKVLNPNAAHYDPSQVGVTVPRMPTLRSARKIDALTVELVTSEPDALLPLHLTSLYMASPAQWKRHHDAVPPAVIDGRERSRLAWRAFAASPSGTGP